MGKYNWQQSDWPHFYYDLSSVQSLVIAIAEKSGAISGKLAYINENLHTEALINLVVEEAIKTSAIEGEYLSRLDVRSSVKNKLGLNASNVTIHDKRAKAIVDMMFDMRTSYLQPLTEKKLFNWHAMLMSGSVNQNITAGSYRTHAEPMQIISGWHGKTKIHFEAPPSHQVAREMKQFIKWFNDSAPGKSNAIAFAPVRAAIAHLYFESVHPFEDGNGRIGRAIAEKALSQGFGYPALLSLSQAIEAEKKAYYAALQSASLSNEITDWINYFVNLIYKAQLQVEVDINFILQKSRYYARYEHQLNERQLKVIHRMLQAGAKGFTGGMSAKKYITITGTSKATATRDLQALLEMRAFKQTGKGRSVRYEINFD